MNSEEERQMAKIRYEKPTAVDLGPTALIVGASCAPGGLLESHGKCVDVGNSAAETCDLGNAAGSCTDGASPD